MDTNQWMSALSRHRGICFPGSPEGGITYPDLFDLVNRNVETLRQMGYGRAERGGQPAIALHVSLGWRAVPLLLAAFCCRITAVPVDPFRNPALTRSILEQVRPELVLDDRFVDERGRLHRALSAFPAYQDALRDVALILYTSGTTGFPKGVMLTYDNLWSNLADILRYFPIRAEDRLLLVRPLTHASAVTGEMLPALFRGCAIVMKSNELTPLASVREIEAQGISVCCTTPTVAASWAHFASRYDVSGLKRLVLSGEALRPRQKQNIFAAFPGAAIGNAYGLTEASPRVSCKLRLTADEDVACVGFPLRQVRWRILDRQGDPAGEGVSGTLAVAGPNVMKGYYGEARETAAKIRDGWLLTSDLASSRDGQLYVYGRADDLIIRGGVNIHPVEVESALLEIEGIHEALVFGKEDRDRVRIHAWVVADPELNPAEVYQRILKHPSDTRLWTDVIEMKSALPRTASGKLLRPKFEKAERR